MREFLNIMALAAFLTGGTVGHMSGKINVLNPLSILNLVTSATSNGGPAYAIAVTDNSVLIGRDANGRLVYEYLVPSNGYHAHY